MLKDYRVKVLVILWLTADLCTEFVLLLFADIKFRSPIIKS